MYYYIQSFSHIINLERSCYFSTMTAQDSVPKRCDVGSFGGGGGGKPGVFLEEMHQLEITYLTGDVNKF